MKGRWQIPLAVVLVTAFLAVLANYLHFFEPHYEGKSLSAWIEESRSLRAASDPWFFNAMLEIGPKAIPYLVKAIKPKTPGFTESKFYCDLREKMPDLIRDRLPKPRFMRLDLSRNNAALALLFFGERAKTVLPLLEASLEHGPWFRGASRTHADWLQPGMNWFDSSSLGISQKAKASIPSLIAALKHPNPSMRFFRMHWPWLLRPRCQRGCSGFDTTPQSFFLGEPISTLANCARFRPPCSSRCIGSYRAPGEGGCSSIG